MGIQELQRFIEAQVPGACVPVDLLKIARGVTLSRPRTPSSRHQPLPSVELCLVLDAEGCLDRLYGGYFSDWVCGGQWNRMLQFLAVLIQTVQANNMELAVFFSGALELPRQRQWVAEQYSRRRDINQTLKHAALKSTPPPKVWWTAPACLRTALRMALRHLQVQVLQSMEDHRQEVMSFCRDNNYHGVMAEDAEYIMLNPPRYFSAKQMKLTYKGSLETKEFILSEVARGLDLQPGRFCLLAALLGSYLLTDDQLAEFHTSLPTNGKVAPDDLTSLLVEFVRSLPSVDDLDEVGLTVFKSASDPRIARLKQSVQYFQNGCRDVSGAAKVKPAPGLASVLASDAAPELQGDARRLYQRVPSGGAEGSVNGLTAQLERLTTEEEEEEEESSSTPPGAFNNGAAAAVDLGDVGPEGPFVVFERPELPPVTPEVLRTAADRHSKGLMGPWVYQVLSQGEIKIPVCMEDELGRELPNSTLFYRPVRERIYAIIFNLYHHSFLHNKDKDLPQEERHPIPLVQIREWAYSRNNPYTRADLVTAKPLGWGVPTVQRLWFGTADDDKKRRLRALLTCMNSDSPYIRNPAYVPQHLLVLACVLRYIMSQSGLNGQAFLCKPELDAFIAQALSPKLTDSEYLQDLQLPSISARGIQLANLFMQGVETVLFANDACGAPVPWLMCCPWLFFDGKLFHSYLLKATQCRNVLELCDGRPDVVQQLDALRTAVLDGLHVQYARPQHGQRRALGGPLLGRGARLEIGGVVVGSWAGSVGGRGRALAGAPLMRTIGRGGHPMMRAPDGYTNGTGAARAHNSRLQGSGKKKSAPPGKKATNGAGDGQFEDSMLRG